MADPVDGAPPIGAPPIVIVSLSVSATIVLGRGGGRAGRLPNLADKTKTQKSRLTPPASARPSPQPGSGRNMGLNGVKSLSLH